MNKLPKLKFVKETKVDNLPEETYPYGAKVYTDPQMGDVLTNYYGNVGFVQQKQKKDWISMETMNRPKLLNA